MKADGNRLGSIDGQLSAILLPILDKIKVQQ